MVATITLACDICHAVINETETRHRLKVESYKTDKIYKNLDVCDNCMKNKIERLLFYV